MKLSLIFTSIVVLLTSVHSQFQTIVAVHNAAYNRPFNPSLISATCRAYFYRLFGLLLPPADANGGYSYYFGSGPAGFSSFGSPSNITTASRCGCYRLILVTAYANTNFNPFDPPVELGPNMTTIRIIGPSNPPGQFEIPDGAMDELTNGNWGGNGQVIVYAYEVTC